MAEKPEKTENAELLQFFGNIHAESEQNLSEYKARWADSTRLLKGVFPDKEVTESKVRKRTKIFFRKAFAAKWRMMSSFFQAFLQDRNKFKLEGVDTLTDAPKAAVLQSIVELRVRQMYRKDDLFLQFIHAFSDIFDFSWAVGKMTWSKKEKRPKFILYPPEQVFPDMSAETPARMQYVIFVNYLTKEELEAKYDDDELDWTKLAPVKIPDDSLRASRFERNRDPMRPVVERMYPAPGKLNSQEKTSYRDRYEEWEIFWRDDDKVKFAVTQGTNMFLKEPIDSPYGDDFSFFVPGMCLVEAHKLIGEGFPESQAGPQESLNSTLNMRKDELGLAMSPMSIVNKWANVDYQSLMNARPGGIVTADSTADAVQQLSTGNVTQTAYAEAGEDERMMNELQGLPPVLQGMQESNTKATTAQLNQTNANLKVDLFLAIVAETFIKNFYQSIIKLEQLFETDDTVFRVANEPLRVSGHLGIFDDDITDIDEFDFDFILEVTPDKASRQVEVNQLLLAMDKMIMANQSLVSLMSVPGAVPQEGVRLFDLTQVMTKFLPKIGIKDYVNFFFQSGQPVLDEGAGGTGGAGNAIQGSITPQVGGADQGLGGAF